MASKKVSTSEALQECLDSYNFQYGSRTNSQVVYRMRKLITKHKKMEEADARNNGKEQDN